MTHHGRMCVVPQPQIAEVQAWVPQWAAFLKAPGASGGGVRRSHRWIIVPDRFPFECGGNFFPVPSVKHDLEYVHDVARLAAEFVRARGFRLVGGWIMSYWSPDHYDRYGDWHQPQPCEHLHFVEVDGTTVASGAIACIHEVRAKLRKYRALQEPPPTKPLLIEDAPSEPRWRVRHRGDPDIARLPDPSSVCGQQ